MKHHNGVHSLVKNKAFVNHEIMNYSATRNKKKLEDKMRDKN